MPPGNSAPIHNTSEHTLDIIAFIATLEQLQVVIEREFPEAWNFIQPGFDEG